MLEIMDRRVTRSLSNELQARQAAQAQQSASNSYIVQNSYHAHAHPQHQHIYTVGHGAQEHQPQQEPGSGGMLQHHQHHQHQQYQQQMMGMSGSMGGGGGGGGGSSAAPYPRTTSEEMFLNTLMNTPLSPGTPTMEAASLGFLESLQPPQTMRGNSEELFNSWIATESLSQFHNNVYNGPSPNGNRLRQNPRRGSSELQAIIAQQNGTPWSPRAENVEQQPYMQTSSYLSDEIVSNASVDQKQYRPNLPEDKSGPPEFNTTNSLKNMWVSSTSPMTRSRSSELRRRYAQLEGLPSPPSLDVFQKLATQGTLEGFVNHPHMPPMGALARGIGSMGNNNEKHHNNLVDTRQVGSPQVPGVPPMSSPAPVNHNLRIQQQQPPPAVHSGLSDVVGLLKGSLDRKKMQTQQQLQVPRQQQLQVPHQLQQQQQQVPHQQQQQVPHQQQQQMPHQQHQQGPHQQQAIHHQQEELLQGVVRSTSFTQEPPQQGGRSMPTAMSSPQVSARQDESLNRSQDLRQHTHSDSMLVGPLGQLQQQSSLGRAHSHLSQQNSLGRVHSPDESSCGGLSHSAGMATSDGPSNSAVSVHRQALKRGSGAVVDQPSPKRQSFNGRDSGGPTNGENFENGAAKAASLQKPDHLTRASSITSSLRTGFQLNEIDGATRKRRVERQRKMAEAKGRGNAPPLPADMQAAIKRCDTLEKEVRSLKLNLSFMNRKDSEQTKRIEELEQQNDELKDELDRVSVQQ